MPRLSTSLLRKASSQSPLLVHLLRATHDLTLARNELRWLKEYFTSIQHLKTTNSARYPQQLPQLHQLCRIRATGKPLQYILGSQPFGDLEILCRKGVLIPRHGRLQNHTEPLRILDLCAGTGCIGLSLLASLHKNLPTQIRAVDINKQARTLAWKSIRLNQRLGRLPPLISSSQFEYVIADILDVDKDVDIVASGESFQITVANPPYISVPSFKRDTSRSARNFEPKSALVPPLDWIEKVGLKGEETGDLFYARILKISWRAESQIVCMEVADLEQALRVLDLVDMMEKEMGYIWDVKQIWRDGVDIHGNRHPVADTGMAGVSMLGDGNGRAVVLARGQGMEVINSNGLALD